MNLGGAILALAGVAVLSLKLSSEINIGDLLTLCCAVGFAFHIFYTAKFVKDEDPVLTNDCSNDDSGNHRIDCCSVQRGNILFTRNGRVDPTPLPRHFFDNDRIFIANSCAKIHN